MIQVLGCLKKILIHEERKKNQRKRNQNVNAEALPVRPAVIQAIQVNPVVDRVVAVIQHHHLVSMYSFR